MPLDAPSLDPSETSAPLPIRACLNCGMPLLDAYCGACGQRDMPVDPSLRELVAEAWEAFVSVDGKVLSSLRLMLLRPGALTVEYLSGRRMRHLPPLRLYLICSVGYFLISSLVPEKPDAGRSASFTFESDTVKLTERAQGHDSASVARDAAARATTDSIRRAILVRHRIPVVAGVLDSTTRAMADSVRLEDQVGEWKRTPMWMRKRFVHGIAALQHDKKGFGRDYMSQLPRLMFLLMPVSALLLMLAYRSRRRRYPVHLIVALHLHAFVFAILALDELRVLMPRSPLTSALKLVTILWICAYLPLALRRVYGGRRRYAVLRSVVVLAEYSIVGVIAVSLMAIGLLMTY